jgi:hypothetical protein
MTRRNHRMDQTPKNAADLGPWLDNLPDGPLTDTQIAEAMLRMSAAYDREVAREARVLTDEEAARLHAIAAKAIKEEEARQQQVDQEERQAGSTQNVHIWIAACDHLASLTNEAFADWIEDEVFVQFPIQTPMSDILQEVIDRLRRLPRRPQ